MPLKKLEEAVLNGKSEKKVSNLVKKAMESFKTDEIVSLLTPYIKHKNSKVRFAALCALEETKHYNLDDLLKPLANDRNLKIRLKAKKVLKQIEEDEEII